MQLCILERWTGDNRDRGTNGKNDTDNLTVACEITRSQAVARVADRTASQQTI